jgi:hypothetical protein
MLHSLRCRANLGALTGTIRQEATVFRPASAVLAAALALAAVPAAAATVSTAWARLQSNDQEACLRIAFAAIEAVGFRASISQDRQTVFGWRGEEALTVRCIAGHGVAAVFAWVNDQSNDSAPLVESVTRAFRAPGAAAGGTLGGGPVKR